MRKLLALLVLLCLTACAQNPPSNLVAYVDTAVSTSENAYCPASEVATTNGTFDDVSELPRTCVNTAMANTPSPGSVLTVVAGSASDLQSKLNSVACGQTIQIPAAVGGVQQVYQGNFTISKSCPAGQWITIETDAVASIPPEGNRISPSYAGYDYPRGIYDDGGVHGYPSYPNAPVHGVYMPKLIVSAVNQPVITVTGSARIRFIGLEITSVTPLDTHTMLFYNNTNDHIILDRLWIHGGDSATETSTNQVSQGVIFNSSTYSAVVDSRVTDFHCHPSGMCVEAQAIGGGNGTGGGPEKFYNNFLSSAGEPFFHGGGNATGVPTDIELRQTHTFQPLFWYVNDSAYAGSPVTCKNTGEFKTGIRVLVEGNIFENSWGTCIDQNGFGFLVGPKNQGIVPAGGTAVSDGAGNLTWASGNTFSSNEVSASCATPNHCHFRWNGEGGFPRQVQTFTDAQHISISPAPPAGTASFAYCLPGGGPTVTITDFTFRYNVIKNVRNGIQFSSVPSDCGDQSLGVHRVVFHDVVEDNFNGPRNTITGGCCTYDSVLSLVNGQTGSQAISDATIKHFTALPFAPTGASPGLQFLVNFTNNTTTPINNITIKDNIGPAGLKSGDPVGGKCNAVVGTTNVLNCESGTAWVFTNNLMTGGSFNSQPANGLQSPFPTGTLTTTDYTTVGFVNLNSAKGGDYHLTAGSVGHNAASDGTDIGADISKVNSYTANVN